MFKKVWLGLGYLPGYGAHPGWFWLCALSVLGLLSGGWAGFSAMAGIFGIAFLIGAYGRGDEYLRSQSREGSNQ